MTKAYICVNSIIEEGTSLQEIIDLLLKTKENMDKINVELYSTFHQTQICLSSEKKDCK